MQRKMEMEDGGESEHMHKACHQPFNPVSEGM